MSDSIDDIRSKIDAIDDKLLDLLNQRANKSIEAKKTSGATAPLRRGREAAIINRMASSNQGPLTENAVRNIFETIVYNSRGLQVRLRVSHLGPAGTYSEQATNLMFGQSIDLIPKRSMAEVVNALEQGDTDIAVIPVENSSEGSVSSSSKLLRSTNLPIIAEYNLAIKHALLSKAESLSDIETIYAHPQAIGQCRDWLVTHAPGAELVECQSNAAGLERASTDQSSAAIAAEYNSVKFDMNILESQINDEPDNTTRFVALAKDPVAPTGHDKTSIFCTVEDKPGALHKLLGVFDNHGISLTRLDSHPDKGGGYGFFIDFVGHKEDEDIAEALGEAQEFTATFKVIGSYPREAA